MAGQVILLQLPPVFIRLGGEPYRVPFKLAVHFINRFHEATGFFSLFAIKQGSLDGILRNEIHHYHPAFLVEITGLVNMIKALHGIPYQLRGKVAGYFKLQGH